MCASMSPLSSIFLFPSFPFFSLLPASRSRLLLDNYFGCRKNQIPSHFDTRPITRSCLSISAAVSEAQMHASASGQRAYDCITAHVDLSRKKENA